MVIASWHPRWDCDLDPGGPGPAFEHDGQFDPIARDRVPAESHLRAASVIHPDTELRFVSSEVGLGVFATTFIPRGTIVWTLCQFDRIFTSTEAVDMAPNYRALLERFGYIDSTGNYVLCWDSGRHVNHSCDPTMLDLGDEFEVAIRDIAAGEQLTCEYGGLNLTGRLRCRCGSANCRGTVGGEDVLQLWRQWDGAVQHSLASANGVAQPLLPFARQPNQFWDWVHGLSPAPSARALHAGGDASTDDASDRPWAFAPRNNRR